METRDSASPTDLAFDEYADGYDEALQKGISVSGEDKEYFARGRIAWLAGRIGALEFVPRQVLDYGCGTGSATPYLLEILGAERVLGIDPSARSIEAARRAHGSGRAEFAVLDDEGPEARFDLAFCNGVFHHIPPDRRADAVGYVHRALRPGGLFAFWENNPWNPGTRIVMSRIPFDRDAITLSPPEARRLLAAGGFEVVRVDFRFIFPAALKALRFLEDRLAGAPLGAQYLVLGRKRDLSPDQVGA